MGILGISAVLELGSKILDKVFPDPAHAAAAKLELVKLEQSGELAKLAAETDIIKGQLEINKTEALSESLWVSGWRPFAGWVGGAALAYAAILEPLLRFIAQVVFGYFGVFPVIDTEITLQVLLGLLGLGAYRSYDKGRNK